MTKITVDDALKERLHGLKEQIELCDEAGEVIGHVLPDAVYKKMIYDFMRESISTEELDKRLAEPGGSSLKEIISRLEQS
ncbi:MAG: hypothetical protein IID45_10740 [Planctomycetes bacterium]|nr:hypothetical protein [Planctomycetota bacterium]